MSLQINRDPFSIFNQNTLGDLSNSAGTAAGSLLQQVAQLVQDGTIDSPATSPEAQATEQFQEQFGDLAQDKDAFHSMMKQVYGESYDAGKAETYRQMALKGDYSFLPPVQFVSRETLNGGNGAYNEAEGVIYLAEDLKGDPAKMQSVFVEEAGHHLDAMLNTGDSMGDEGELFRRLMSGEKLTNQQIAGIRAENDHGVIMVDGKAVEVEFWFGSDFVDAVSDVVDTVVDVVSDVVDAVGDAVGAVADAVGSAVSGVVSGIGEAIEGVADSMMMFGAGLWEGVSGFATNLLKGDITEAFRSVVRGADKAFLQAPTRLVQGAVNALEETAKGATYLLGPIGKPIREEVIPRAADIVRQSVNTVAEIGRDVFRMVTETPLNFADDLYKAGALAVQGDWEGAAKQFGMSFVNAGARILGGVVDIVAHFGQGLIDGIQTGIGLAPPSRPLTDEEEAMLREVYGDSIDYDSIRVKFGGPLNADSNGRARVVGNYIYMPSADAGKPIKNPDGTLTEFGETLVHETSHIWQSQNGGGDYIHQALYGQEFGDGYNYNTGIAEGKSFSELNPEQQGDYIAEVLAPFLILPGDAEENLRANLTGAELEYALDALRHIRSGSGTPEGNL